DPSALAVKRRFLGNCDRRRLHCRGWRGVVQAGKVESTEDLKIASDPRFHDCPTLVALSATGWGFSTTTTPWPLVLLAIGLKYIPVTGGRRSRSRPLAHCWERYSGDRFSRASHATLSCGRKAQSRPASTRVTDACFQSSRLTPQFQSAGQTSRSRHQPRA